MVNRLSLSRGYRRGAGRNGLRTAGRKTGLTGGRFLRTARPGGSFSPAITVGAADGARTAETEAAALGANGSIFGDVVAWVSTDGAVTRGAAPTVSPPSTRVAAPIINVFIGVNFTGVLL